MPLLNPSLWLFVTDVEHFRSYNIKPTGWREAKFANGQIEFDEFVTDATYSFTSMPAKDGNEKSEELLTLTIPDLPFRTWCPNGDFDAPDEVKLFTFAADGYCLERIPELHTTITAPKTPKLKPINKLSEAETIPILELAAVPKRKEFVLQHGIGKEAWWLAPVIEQQSKQVPAPQVVERMDCNCGMCAYLMAPRIKRS